MHRSSTVTSIEAINELSLTPRGKASVLYDGTN